jgi:hypothetical protein
MVDQIRLRIDQVTGHAVGHVASRVVLLWVCSARRDSVWATKSPVANGRARVPRGDESAVLRREPRPLRLAVRDDG